MKSRPIVFCATGIDDTSGGIAAANRNVLAALRTAGTEHGLAVEALILHETRSEDRRYRAFKGNRLAFGAAVYSACWRASLVVFDHVHLTVPAMLAPKSFRAPTIVFAHGSEAAKRVRPASVRAFKAADAVLTNSAYTLRNMRSVMDAFNGSACPLGLPPHHEMTCAPPDCALGGIVLRAADGVERQLGNRMILLVSRLDAGEREKGHRELIDAMPELIQSLPAAQLVLAGGGSDEADLRAIASKSEAASNIFLTGRVVHDFLQTLYAACYAYVMPSRQEGFGLVYLEAMNFAKPCVACRDDGGAEVVADNETGFLVSQPVNRIELVNTLARLLGDESRARAMGIAGWMRLNELYTAAAYQNRVAKAVRDVLAQRDGSSIAS